MDWDDFKFVQAIAQTGSVRGAGELLRVHGSTVARRLEHLERRIGTRLFTRTSTGMDITPAGAEVIDALNRVAGELDAVERRLSERSSNAMGSVVLAAAPGLIGTLLIPHLTALMDEHPEIELRLSGVQALEKLHSGEADAALWITNDPPADLIGRSLGTVMACVYTSQHSMPVAVSHPGAGVPAATRWIGAAGPSSRSAEVHAGYFTDLVSPLQLDDDDLRALAVQAGLGAALLPCYLGDSTPGIRRVDSFEPMAQGDVWLLMRPDSRGAVKSRMLTVYLQELFEAHRARLSGTSATCEIEP